MPGSKNYILVNNCADISIEKFIYQLQDNKDADNTSSRLEIRYPDSKVEGRVGHLYFKTPTLKLGHLNEYKGESRLELDLGIDSGSAREFKRFIEYIDMYHLAQIEANQKLWNYDGGVPLAVLQEHYLPSIKKSNYTYDDALHVKFSRDNVLMFDQNDKAIKPEDLEAGSSVRAVLELVGLGKDNGFFQTIWRLVQIKARVTKEKETEKETVVVDERPAPVEKDLATTSEDHKTNISD